MSDEILDEIKIDKVEEKEEVKDDKPDDKKDTKRLLLAITVLVALFAIAFFAVRYVRDPTGNVVTIDDLHQRNLEGKESDINYMYKGYSFVKSGNLWYTEVQNEKGTLFEVPLHYAPKDLDDVSVMGDIDDKFLTQELFITFDPLGTDLQYVALSSAELSLSLVKGFGLEPTAACTTNESSACTDREIIDECKKSRAVIMLKQEGEAEVMMRDNCVIIKGEGDELVRATDRFLYRLYSIMD